MVIKRWNGKIKSMREVFSMNGMSREMMLEAMKTRLKPNLSKLTKIAKNNTKYNEQGYAVISSDDEWRSIDDRDEFYEELCTTKQ